MDIFPVSAADYRAFKSPRYGSGNPERSLNPFWLAMARHRWPPSRARLHFGMDSDPNQPPRTEGDVVWTAVRQEALTMPLPDGRMLQVGGRIESFGDESVDAWVYDDVVVTQPSGDIDILTCPRDIFPHIFSPVGVMQGGHVFIFGIIDRRHHPDRTRGPVILRLDTDSYAIEPIVAAQPPVRVNVYTGCESRDGKRVIFPIVRQEEADPELGIPFDLATMEWGQPVPYRHPRPREN